MRLTNAYLGRVYKEFNKKHFGNRLPKDMIVRFDVLRTSDDGCQEPCATTAFMLNRPLYIQINKRLAWQSMLANFSLIHEMVHVALPEVRGHGPKFQKEMLRLAKKGAFKHMW